MSGLSEKQKEQLKWLNTHRVEDKDAQEIIRSNFNKIPYQDKKKKRKNKQTSHFKDEISVDLEIDLHGDTIDEAMAKVELNIQSMKKAGYKKLRIIHGIGKNAPHSIAWNLNHLLEGKWKNLLEHFYHENGNEGATLIILR